MEKGFGVSILIDEELDFELKEPIRLTNGKKISYEKALELINNCKCIELDISEKLLYHLCENAGSGWCPLAQC